MDGDGGKPPPVTKRTDNGTLILNLGDGSAPFFLDKELKAWQEGYLIQTLAPGQRGTVVAAAERLGYSTARITSCD